VTVRNLKMCKKFSSNSDQITTANIPTLSFLQPGLNTIFSCVANIVQKLYIILVDSDEILLLDGFCTKNK